MEKVIDEEKIDEEDTDGDEDLDYAEDHEKMKPDTFGLDNSSLWILGRLYFGEILTRQELLRQLCNASFEDMIKTGKDYDDVLKMLQKSNLIDNDELTANPPLKIHITEEGIIRLRHFAIQPVIKTKQSKEPIEIGFQRYDLPIMRDLIDKFKQTDLKNISKFVVNNIISNAPLFFKFLNIIKSI